MEPPFVNQEGVFYFGMAGNQRMDLMESVNSYCIIADDNRRSNDRRDCLQNVQ
jgi:hypothetical protein